MCSQGDALRHSLLTLYLGASYNQGLAGPSPAIANASGHGPPAAPSPDKDSPDAKGGGVSLAIRNDLSLVETQVCCLSSELLETRPPFGRVPFVSIQYTNVNLLCFVQCYLDREGASELLIDLIINNTYSNRIFVETIELAIALLEGGNTQVQVLCSL